MGGRNIETTGKRDGSCDGEAKNEGKLKKCPKGPSSPVKRKMRNVSQEVARGAAKETPKPLKPKNPAYDGNPYLDVELGFEPSKDAPYCLDNKETVIGDETHATLIDEKIDAKMSFMKQYFRYLMKKYPVLKDKTKRYKIFEIDDPEVFYFLENCSLRTLQELGISNAAVNFPLLNVPGQSWEKAAARNPDIAPYKDVVASQPDEEITLEKIYHAVEKAILELQPLVNKTPGLQSMFSDVLTPKMMLSIFVNENAPNKIDKASPFTHKARLEVYRMMLDSGWQPQKILSQNKQDNEAHIVSYGIDQFRDTTSKGLMSNYGGKELAKVLNPDYTKQTTIEQQVTRSVLLAYENLHKFEQVLKDEDKYKSEKFEYFMDVYTSSGIEERRRFVLALVASMHNGGLYGKFVTPGRRAMMNGKYETLEEARHLFINGGGYNEYSGKASGIFNEMDACGTYAALEEWDPRNGVNFIEQRKVRPENVDAPSMQEYSFPVTEPANNPDGMSQSGRNRLREQEGK